MLQLLQTVLSCPLIGGFAKDRPAPSPLGVECLVLDEQEQKLHTYLRDGGRKGPYGDDLCIYLRAYTERRPDKKVIFLSFFDLFHLQTPC